jgi:hypothetical protein
MSPERNVTYLSGRALVENLRIIRHLPEAIDALAAQWLPKAIFPGKAQRDLSNTDPYFLIASNYRTLISGPGD